ncbi:MAG: ribbon-helix-helix protein, CopG family [Gammaproteobacteria bacterium]|nr:ribbon-helix-helix protein, CopG family [Gammaproteobacteria bacterium]
MNGFSVRCPAELYAGLSREAGRRNVSRWSFVRELIANTMNERGCAPPRSCADLAGDLIGAVQSGRFDLATSTRLLDEAFLEDSHDASADGLDDC